jgi:hypothetical protein
LTAHSLTDDAIFAAALAAWWQLRRSACLLPHLRKSPVRLRSGSRVVSRIMTIVVTPLRMTCRRDDGHTFDVLATSPMAVRVTMAVRATGPGPSSGGDQVGPATVPLPHEPIVVPRPRPSMDPPTCPLLAVGNTAGGADRRRTTPVVPPDPRGPIRPLAQSPTAPRGSRW